MSYQTVTMYRDDSIIGAVRADNTLDALQIAAFPNFWERLGVTRITIAHSLSDGLIVLASVEDALDAFEFGIALRIEQVLRGMVKVGDEDW